MSSPHPLTCLSLPAQLLASLLTTLVQTFVFCPSKSPLQFQLDVKLLLPILELLIIIVQC